MPKKVKSAKKAVAVVPKKPLPAKAGNAKAKATTVAKAEPVVAKAVAKAVGKAQIERDVATMSGCRTEIKVSLTQCDAAEVKSARLILGSSRGTSVQCACGCLYIGHRSNACVL